MYRHLAGSAILTFLITTSTHGATPMQIDTLQIQTEPLVPAASLQSTDAWVASGDAALTTAGGRIRLSAGAEGMAWTRQAVDGRILVRCRLRLDRTRPDAVARLAFCASQPDGTPLPGGELQCYAVELTGGSGGAAADTPGHVRLLQLPGPPVVDENPAVTVPDGREVDLAVLKSGNRVKVFLDGAPVLDWWIYGEPGYNEPVLDAGQLGVHASGCRVDITRFEVLRVTSWTLADIEQLKDLHLETDLTEAVLVPGTGPGPSGP